MPTCEGMMGMLLLPEPLECSIFMLQKCQMIAWWQQEQGYLQDLP